MIPHTVFTESKVCTLWNFIEKKEKKLNTLTDLWMREQEKRALPLLIQLDMEKGKKIQDIFSRILLGEVYPSQTSSTSLPHANLMVYPYY